MNVYSLELQATRGQPATRTDPKASALAIAVAAAVAIAIQSLWLPVDADVSWLITVSERVLAGDRLYIDILEVNPPASVWLYVPLVWLAQLLGARPEAVVVAAFAGAGCASVAATLGLASRLRDAPSQTLLAVVLATVALVLPMALFAQREHAALLLALPALATLALLAEGKPIARPALYASGLAAGALVIIKPYFLLAIVGPALWAAYRRRSLVPLLPGIAAAAAAILLYGAAILLFAGAYFDWIAVIAQTYAPMHAPWWKLIVGPSLYPMICLGLVALARPQRVPPLAVAWAIGAAGFLIAAIAQGKNYPNHWLPQAGLALAAAVVVIGAGGAARRRARLVGFGLAFVAACVMYSWAIRPDPAVASAIERVAPPAPRIIALSTQLTTGHPVTRNLGGRWVGSRAGLFTAGGARFVGLDSEFVRAAYRRDIGAFYDDVRRHRPDVILVDTPSKAWLMGEPAIARAMGDYECVAEAAGIEIWLPRERRR